MLTVGKPFLARSDLQFGDLWAGEHLCFSSTLLLRLHSSLLFKFMEEEEEATATPLGKIWQAVPAPGDLGLGWLVSNEAFLPSRKAQFSPLLLLLALCGVERLSAAHFTQRAESTLIPWECIGIPVGVRSPLWILIWHECNM